MTGINELAPTGTLRAGMNLGNNLFTRKNESGELLGVSVDLMQELAKRLGVPLELVVYEQPGQVADDATQDVWDIAILAIEKTRAKTISFSPGMTEIEAGYVVHQSSTLKSTEEVDAKGIKIAAPAKAGYELYLTSALKNASIVQTKNFADSIQIFNDHSSWPYMVIYSIMVIGFTFLYTALIFNPKQISEDLKRNNGFVPGVKPGQPTADYIGAIMDKITLPGAIFLALVGIMPGFAQRLGVTQGFSSFFGGTSLLIMVGVVLDTLQQIETYLSSSFHFLLCLYNHSVSIS